MKKYDKLLIRVLAIQAKLQPIEQAIESTPTGAIRDILCDINIDIQSELTLLTEEVRGYQKMIEFDEMASKKNKIYHGRR